MTLVWALVGVGASAFTALSDSGFLRAHVWSLGIRIEKCKVPNPTQLEIQSLLIVFQIQIQSEDPLTCYSRLTHTHTL